MIHEMHLHNEPFEKIKAGIKTIEMRVNDEKRRLFKVGDTIVITSRKSGEKINVKIVALYKMPSFADLYNKFNKIQLGYNKNEDAKPEDLEQYYPEEEVKKYGVVGIELKVIK